MGGRGDERHRNPQSRRPGLLRRVAACPVQFTAKKGKQVVTSGTIILSSNRKSRTVNFSETDAQGHSYNSTVVYDKQ